MAHPDNGILLSLDGNLQLRKKSYIKTDGQIIIDMASLKPYDSSKTESKLQQESYQTLVTYIDFTQATVNPRPRRDLSNLSSVGAQPQMPPAHCYSPVTSQASIAPPSSPFPTVTNRRQGSSLYSGPRRDRRTLPYSHPSSTPPPSKPESAFDILVAFIFSLLFLGFLSAVSYKGYRFFLRGRCALKKMKWKWNEVQEVLVRARPLENIKTTSTKLGLQFISKGLDSIRCINEIISETFTRS